MWRRPDLTSKLAVRLLFIVGLLGPALMSFIAPSTWASQESSLIVRNFFLPVQAYGVVFLFAGICVCFKKWRDVGYTVGAFLYFIFSVGVIIAALQGKAHTFLIFTLPITFGAFVNAIFVSVHDRYLPEPTRREELEAQLALLISKEESGV